MDQTFFIEVLLFILETKFCQDLRFVVFIVEGRVAGGVRESDKE